LKKAEVYLRKKYRHEFGLFEVKKKMDFDEDEKMEGGNDGEDGNHD
jgi:hypothetical protein